MSPSNRAGGTVDHSVTDDAPVSAEVAGEAGESASRRPGPGNGNGNGNGHEGAAETSTSSRSKRTTVTEGSAGPPARGSSTERGVSSTTIVRSGADPDQEGSASADVALEPVRPSAPATSPSPGLPSPTVAPSAPVRPTGRRLDQIDTGLTVTQAPTGPPPGPTRTSISDHLVAPVPRVLGRRPRVRKVTRVVRHVDPWSVFKVSLIFNLVLYVVLLTAGVLLWNVAHATGTVDNMERFFESFGWDEFEFDGGAIFHNAWITGLFGVVGLTGAAVLGATLFNLITDLVGGVRMTVLEEEVVEKTAAPIRRFVVQRPSGVADDTGGVRRPGPPTSPPASPPTNLPARGGG